jgi:hypothetical protein
VPSLLEPTPPSLARQFYRRRAKVHHSQSRRIVRLTIVALFLLFGWSGWYLAKRGFGKEWRDRVSDELHKRGVEASIQRLTLDPVRGLIAQNVRIYDFKNRENTLAVISEVALDINYAALLHHKPFLNALDVHGAELTIPNPIVALVAPGAPKTQIKELRAHIYFPPEQIYVSQAEGMFCGLRISATGQLIKRNDYKPSEEISDEDLGTIAYRPPHRGRIAPLQFSRRRALAPGKICRRPFAVRDRARGSDVERRPVAARCL